MATVNGTIGNDFIHVLGDGYVAPAGLTDMPLATDGADTITSGGGGVDTVHAGGGNDSIHFGADLASDDIIDGGIGTDTLYIDDQVSITFGANTLKGVEAIIVSASVPQGFGGATSITTNDATVAAGQRLQVYGSSLPSNLRFTFNGSAETDGTFYLYGGVGRDIFTGSKGKDSFVMSKGGNDTVVSGGGYDSFTFGDTLTAFDQVTADAKLGGKVDLNGGSYAAGLTLLATTLVNVSQITVEEGYSYNLTTDDGTVAAGKVLEVDAIRLNALDLPVGTPDRVLTFNGAAETNGEFLIKGGGAADVLTGGAGNDRFELLSFIGNSPLVYTQLGGGADIVNGGGGNDAFYGASDQMTIDGGSGFDTIHASASVFGGVFANYTASNWTNIEKLLIGTLFVTVSDGNVAAGKTLRVQGNGGQFDGSAETDGHFKIMAMTSGKWIGGALDDSFQITGANNVYALGGAGADSFTLIYGFSANTKVDGGGGSDTIRLGGDFSAGLVITGAMLTGVETMVLTTAGHDDRISTQDDVVAAGAQMTVSATSFNFDEILVFDGSAETDGSFNLKAGDGQDRLTGSAGNDIISGGSGADRITGGLGADQLNGDNGKDTFVYKTLNDSGTTSATRDTITGFVHLDDRIDVSAIDAIAGSGLPDDAFTFRGTAPFTGAGQICAIAAGPTGADTLLRISTDADSDPEATILLVGVTAASLTTADFIL